MLDVDISFYCGSLNRILLTSSESLSESSLGVSCLSSEEGSGGGAKIDGTSGRVLGFLDPDDRELIVLRSSVVLFLGVLNM